MAKIGGAHRGKNGWSSLLQKWVELTVVKMDGTSVIDTVAKMGGAHCGKKDGAHCGKNWWSSLWQKWVKLTVAKMGGAHCGKNGWSSSWQKWVELVLYTP